MAESIEVSGRICGHRTSEMTGVMILAHPVGREVGTDTGCHPDPVGVLEMVSDSGHTEVRGWRSGLRAG